MRLHREKPDIPPNQHATDNDYGEAVPYDDDLHVPCPGHTTERRLIARIDLHVMPFLCVMYVFAFLDRVNIANAALFGMIDELHLARGNRYNIALLIFFVPYCIFEIPSNIFLKRFKPHIWLSGSMFLFGLMMIIQGLVRNYRGLLTTRFFLGLFESGMFPGSFYLISMWYRRSEAQKRFSFFFSSTTVAGAFGGLLAAAIGKMDGLQGYAGWRWIFILEGTVTTALAILFFFLLPDFPEESKWLGPEEKSYLAARLRADQGPSSRDHFTSLKDILNVFKDYKVLLGGLMYLGLAVSAYGYAYFAPGIIESYGYSPIGTQLHSVPPWAAAFAYCMVIATLSDYFQHRFAFAVGSICVAMAGFGILISVHDNTHLQYAALFLVSAGTYTAMPQIVCWFNLNLGGHLRRAVGTAWQNGFANVGGIIAVFAFLNKDAPKYVVGYGICLGFACLSILTCVTYGVGCWAENRRRAKVVLDVASTEHEQAELGDLRPNYRYLL